MATLLFTNHWAMPLPLSDVKASLTVHVCFEGKLLSKGVAMHAALPPEVNLKETE